MRSNHSISLDLDNKLYDYFYDYEDAQKRIICLDNVSIRIHEDYFRILRYAILAYTYLTNHFYYITYISYAIYIYCIHIMHLLLFI